MYSSSLLYLFSTSPFTQIHKQTPDAHISSPNGSLKLTFFVAAVMNFSISSRRAVIWVHFGSICCSIDCLTTWLQEDFLSSCSRISRRLSSCHTSSLLRWGVTGSQAFVWRIEKGSEELGNYYLEKRVVVENLIKVCCYLTTEIPNENIRTNLLPSEARVENSSKSRLVLLSLFLTAKLTLRQFRCLFYLIFQNVYLFCKNII